MSRPPRPAKPASENALIPLNDEQLASGSDALTEMTAADEAVIDASEVLMAVGAMQGLHFAETVAAVAIVQVFLSAKEKFKKIKYLPIKTADGKRKRISSLPEFCEAVIGKTHRRCRQLVENYHAVGPELYEQAERLGMRQQDYSAIKALPDDTREQVKEAIKAGDPDQLKTLLSEVSARNEAQKKAIADLEQTNAVKDRMLDKKSKRIDTLEEKLERPWVPPEGAAAQTAEQHAALEAFRDSVAQAEMNFLQAATAASSIFNSDMPDAVKEIVRNDLEYLAQTFADIPNTHGIDLQFEERVKPSWLKEGMAKLASEKAKKSNGKRES